MSPRMFRRGMRTDLVFIFLNKPINKFRNSKSFNRVDLEVLPESRKLFVGKLLKDMKFLFTFGRFAKLTKDNNFEEKMNRKFKIFTNSFE